MIGDLHFIIRHGLTGVVFLFFVIFGMALFTAQYAQSVLGYSPLIAGLPTASEALGFVAGSLLTLLAAVSLLTPATEDDTSAEDADQALVQWEFHDLVFHARSRSGRLSIASCRSSSEA